MTLEAPVGEGRAHVNWGADGRCLDTIVTQGAAAVQTIAGA
jgi:hypothetical protein